MHVPQAVDIFLLFKKSLSKMSTWKLRDFFQAREFMRFMGGFDAQTFRETRVHGNADNFFPALSTCGLFKTTSVCVSERFVERSNYIKTKGAILFIQ